MKLPPDRPTALAVSFALIRAASRIVPARERAQFAYDWQQKLFHRWQFLLHTGLWTPREAVKLFATAAAVLPEAVQHFGAQDAVRTRVSRFVQSPITCLATLFTVLLLIVFVSGGLPSTRAVFFKQLDHGPGKLVYVWAHNLRGGGDRPIPASVVEAWRTHSQLISSAAPFRAVHRDVEITPAQSQRLLVVTTTADFFRVNETSPLTPGALEKDAPSVLLSYSAWMRLFHASPRVLGTGITIAHKPYKIRGILPVGFEPLSRQMAIYLVQPRYLDDDAYAAIKVNPSVTTAALNQEFSNIAQNVTYYFVNGQIHFGGAQSALWTPVLSFAVGALASALMLLMVFRPKWTSLKPVAHKEKAWFRRSAFFAAKVGLALACVFTACLEWSRSTSSILFGNFDPASGPFLLWLYILGTMGVFFWSAIDQKARCRECLQLLAFPVRMGSPGSLLLDWSGIELCCTAGHGVLHVPHLAPSWAEESDHWIALDDSWQGIFNSDNHR